MEIQLPEVLTEQVLAWASRSGSQRSAPVMAVCSAGWEGRSADSADGSGLAVSSCAFHLGFVCVVRVLI